MFEVGFTELLLIFALSLILSIASSSIDAARRGRVMGMVGGGIMLGVALGAPLGGVLARHGVYLPLQVGAVLALTAALLAALLPREPGSQGEARPGGSAIWTALRPTRSPAS